MEVISYRHTAAALARRDAIAAAYVAAFLDALGPSSRVPAADGPVALPSPSVAADLPIGSPAFTDGELEDLEALAARFDRYGLE